MKHRKEAKSARVRRLLASGWLPGRYPDRVWGGNGTQQQPCAVCDELIGCDQVIMEGEFHGPAGPSRLFFHAGCFWTLAAEWSRKSA